MKRILLVAMALLLCTSCAWWSKERNIEIMKKNLTEAQLKTGESRDSLITSADTIGSTAKSIKKDTQNVKKGIPQETKDEIKTKLDTIQSNADIITGETNKLGKIADDLKDVTNNLQKVDSSSLKALESDKKLLEKIKVLEDEKQVALKKAMNYLIIAAILIIAMSVVGVFQGNIKAVGGIIGGVIIIITALAVSVLYVKLAWVGFIGIGGIVILVAFEIYQALQNKKAAIIAKQESATNEKALEETVLTVEALKEKLPEETKKAFFGDGAYPGKVKHLQTPVTEAKVLSIRKKLKDSIEPTIVK
jgi:uncharacterized membrane protein